MAEESDLKIEESDTGKKKKIIIIGAAVALLLLGGVGGFFLFGGGGGDTTAEPEAASAPQQVDSAAIYVGMPRPFVFNVADDRRDRLVQIRVQLLLRGSVNEKLARQHIPLIEGSLLRVFSSATADQLSSQEGKDKIRERAMIETQEALKKITGKDVIERILFTGFVMQ